MLTTYWRIAGILPAFLASAPVVPVIYRERHTSRNSQRLTLPTPNHPHNATPPPRKRFRRRPRTAAPSVGPRRLQRPHGPHHPNHRRNRRPIGRFVLDRGGRPERM